jgi:hypothetical protein
VTKVEFFKRRITVRTESGEDAYIPDNAWRPEFLVSTRGARREARAATKPAGAAAAAPPADEAAEEDAHLDDEVPGDEIPPADPDETAGGL